MARAIQESTVTKGGVLDGGKIYLPTCAQPNLLKIFNASFPAVGRFGRDPCDGTAPSPPVVSYSIVQFDFEPMVAFNGDTLTQL
mgnify:CR=1 FL=1